MNVELTPDQQTFVQKAIESGRLASPQEAVEQALALWEARERRRFETLAMLDEADASLARLELFSTISGSTSPPTAVLRTRTVSLVA